MTANTAMTAKPLPPEHDAMTYTAPAIEVIPVDGYLAVQFDPEAVLADPTAPEIVADLLCSLSQGNGCPLELTKEDVQDYIRDHAIQGQKLVVQVHP